MKFRKKPVVIEAMQFTDKTKDSCRTFVRCNTACKFDDDGNPILLIQTNEGVMKAELGDWIIKEPFPTTDRTFYPCKPDIFEATYEPVVVQDGTMNVYDIVQKYLKDNGYDGLYAEECGCILEDLMPCDGDCAFHCEPGYRMEKEEAARKGYIFDYDDCDFIVTSEKPEGRGDDK